MYGAPGMSLLDYGDYFLLLVGEVRYVTWTRCYILVSVPFPVNVIGLSTCLICLYRLHVVAVKYDISVLTCVALVLNHINFYHCWGNTGSDLQPHHPRSVLVPEHKVMQFCTTPFMILVAWRWLILPGTRCFKIN